MKDEELQAAIVIRESNVFKNLVMIINSDSKHTGFKDLEDFKKYIRDQKKRINKFIEENIEPD